MAIFLLQTNMIQQNRMNHHPPKKTLLIFFTIYNTNWMTNQRELFWQIKPVTALEATILSQEDIQQGLAWSRPIIGHPEKNIATHIRAVLQKIDTVAIHKEDRLRLRLAAITHDTFKYKEHKFISGQSHGLLARKFMETYTNDQGLLNLLQYHDEPYYAWQLAYCQHNFVLAEKRINKLFEIIHPDWAFFYRFFICDASTGDKILAPTKWFGEKIQERNILG